MTTQSDATRFFLASIVESSEDSIVTVDLEGGITSWNTGAEHLFGYSAEEVMGKSLGMLTLPKEFAGLFERLEKVKSGGSAELFETERRHKDGRHMRLSVKLSPVKDEGGRIIGVSSIARDVTEGARAWNEQRERGERDRRFAHHAALRAEVAAALTECRVSTQEMLQRCTESITRHLPAAFARIWMLNAGKQTLELQASAGMYTHLNGAHSVVPVGKFKIGLIAQEGRPHLTNDVLHDPRISDPEWAHREKMVAFAGYPLQADGPVLGVMALFAKEALPEDTLDALASVAHLLALGLERKRAEEALCEARDLLADKTKHLEGLVQERTKQLQATVAELEAFAYSLSHDMRAPVRAIHSYAQMVLADSRERIPPSDVEYLDRVVSAAGRLDRLIQDMLAFAHLSRREIEMQPVDVEKLLREIIDERPEFHAANADIEIESPLAGVMGHHASLTQCITNLLSNAVKFVRRGVKPRIRIWSEEMGGGDSPGGWVRLWFEDNGIGIGPGGRQRLFEMFQRCHAGKEYQGTGIGLAIVRKAVERMGGKAGVESEVGKGSRFWLELRKSER